MSKQPASFVLVSAFLFLNCTTALGQAASERDSGEKARVGLQAMVAAEGPAYESARDELIKTLDADLSVELLAKDSWELGLAAFIVNQRRSNTELFVDLEKNASRGFSAGDRLGKWASEPLNSAAAAFLLEGVWRRSYPNAGIDLNAFLWRGWNAGVPMELWMSIWRTSGNSNMARLAINALAQSFQGNAQVLAELESALSDPNVSANYKTYILAGLRANPTPAAARIVRAIWPTLLSNDHNATMIFEAATILVKADEPGDRNLLCRFLAESKVSPQLRIRVLKACADDPRSSDIGAIENFLHEVNDKYVKNDILIKLQKYTYEDAVPLLRTTLASQDEPSSVTIMALSVLRYLYLVKHTKKELLDPESITLDVALLRKLRERVGKDPGIVKRIDVAEACLKRVMP